MGNESNPILNDEFDVEERDYEVHSSRDIDKIINQLDAVYGDEIGDYIRGEGEESGWKHDAVLASMLSPYLDDEWEYVEEALERLPVAYGEGDHEHDARVNLTQQYRHTVEGEIETPSDAALGEKMLMMMETDSVQLFDPEEEIYDRVLRKWHPRDFGLEPGEDDIDVIEKHEAVHLIAEIFDTAWNYIYPEKDVRGWQNTLYVYDDELGIYRPRGENQIRLQAEAILGQYSSNNIVNELESKLKRMNKVDSWAMKDCRPDPHRLVVGNGVLDLRDGELDSYSPDEYHRTRIDVDYDPEATCPEIDDFFGDIVADEDVPTLYRVVAHTLSKEYIDEKAMMLVGDGNNGKSTFLNLLEEFIGERNISGRSLQELNEDKWAPADLHGSLANLSGDMSEQEADDLSTFKQLTGGDTLTADIKFEQPVRFTNHASLIFASNGVPDFPDNDMAVWQRWTYLNFPNRFGPDGNKEAEPMRVLMNRITADEELEGLLARCVEEYQAYYDGRDFFPDVGDAHEVRRRMKKAAQPVFKFAEEMLVEVDPSEADSPEESKVWTARVRQAYREYAREEGLPIIDDAQFGQRLVNLSDYSIGKGESRPVGPEGRRSYVYSGVQLTEEAEELLGEEEDGEEDESENAELGDDYEAEDDTEGLNEGVVLKLRQKAEVDGLPVDQIRKSLNLDEKHADEVRRIVEEVRSDEEDENEPSVEDAESDEESEDGVGAYLARGESDD